MDKFIGKMLDNRYELLEIIGVGGTAVVYKAKCHRLNRYVAIKILKDEFASDEDFRNQFHDEAQAVAMLSHPNIVNVYDVSRSGNIDYIVMELIDGITLKEYLSRRGQLSPKEVTVFAMQIARALEHAHEHNIIHRDIKPQNIMLLRDGTVKVADFGIAHFAAKENTYNKGEAIGSVHYVSPEQARGSHVDNRTDLYSLGVVMYEMITARLPFEGDTPVSIALQHINSIAVPPSVFAENVPEKLEEITMKAMNPSLSKRYASARQILEDLDAFSNDQQIKLNILREDTPAVSVAEQDPDATRKLNNTGEVAALLDAENRAMEQRQQEELEAEQAAEDQPDMSQKKKSKGRGISGALLFSIVAVLIFCVGAAYFMVSVFNPVQNNDETKIVTPNLIGQYFSSVTGDPAYADYHIVEGEYVYDESVDAGKIIRQDPVADRKIDKGGTITVIISRGAKTFQLPKYENQEARQVKIELERLGVICTENEPVFNDDIPNGYVIETVPAAGTEMTAGDTVTLTVSKGPEIVLVPMPDLLGCSISEATTRLEAAGLAWEDPVYEEFDGEPDRVISQSVEKDEEIEVGTKISFKVSKLPELPPEVTTTYVVYLPSEEGELHVEIYVDGLMAYTADHSSQDMVITVPLTAFAGDHLVEVYINSMLHARETVPF